MVKFSLTLLLVAFLCGAVSPAFVEFGPYRGKDGNSKMYYYEANNGVAPFVPTNSCPSPMTQLSIDSLDEEINLFSLIAGLDMFTVGRETLTSGSRFKGTFVWQKNGATVNGASTAIYSPFTYAPKWCAGEPNNEGNRENCMTISKRGKNFADMCLNDYGCDYANVGFICQLDNWVGPDLKKIGEYNYRDNNLSRSVKMTYYLNSKTGKSPNDAAAYCYYLGAGWTLAQISTKGEQDYLLSAVKMEASIGTNWRVIVGPKKVNNVWQDRTMGSASPINYPIDWHNGEPNNADGFENCMGIVKGSDRTAMMDVECGLERGAVYAFVCSHVDYS